MSTCLPLLQALSRDELIATVDFFDVTVVGGRPVSLPHPVVVERVAADIDEIVRLVRFPGWQQSAAGEREVKQALRRRLLKHQLHRDKDVFEKAYGYVRQYY